MLTAAKRTLILGRRRPGYLTDDDGANLIQLPDALDDPYWNKSNVAASPNQLTAPNGQVTADLITEDTGSSTHIWFESTETYANATSYKISVYFRALTATAAQIFGRGTPFGTNVWGNFNLATASVGDLGSLTTTGRIDPYPNGWYRCEITGTTTASSSGGGIGFGLVNNLPNSGGRQPSYVGSNKALYAWRARVVLA